MLVAARWVVEGVAPADERGSAGCRVGCDTARGAPATAPGGWCFFLLEVTTRPRLGHRSVWPGSLVVHVGRTSAQYDRRHRRAARDVHPAAAITQANAAGKQPAR